MKTSRLLVLLALSGLYSCSDQSDNESQPLLFPLNGGNSWTYQVTSYNGGTPGTPQTFKMDMKDYTIDGHKGYAWQEYTKGAPMSLLINDDKGNCIESFFDKDKLVHQTVFLKKDATKGDKWIYKAAIFTNDDFSQCEIRDWEVTCTTTDTVIITPKGSFHCVGFKHHPTPDDTMLQYFSENIGMILFRHYEHLYRNIVLHDEHVLIDYSLK